LQVLRVFWQEDRQGDLEISHLLVDDVLGMHVEEVGRKVLVVFVYVVGWWCSRRSEIVDFC